MTDPNDFTVDPEPHLPAGCTEYMGELVTVHQHQLQQFAERLGWARPTGVNKATVEASLTAWYQDARNLTAYIALFLLDHPSNWVPGTFTEPFEQAVCNEIGTPPTRPPGRRSRSASPPSGTTTMTRRIGRT